MNTFDARLSCPFGKLVCGPVRSGKSTYIFNLLKNRDRLLSHHMDYILYFYGERSKTVNDIEVTFGSIVTTIQGMPEDLDSFIRNDGSYGLMIFDDLMASAAYSEQLLQLTTTKCQHHLISWILIMQNLFFGARERITMMRSAHYLTLFSNPLDQSIAQHLAGKIMPNDRKTFMDIYTYATNKPNGYLFIDGAQKTPPEARFRAQLFDAYQQTFVPASKARTLVSKYGLSQKLPSSFDNRFDNRMLLQNK